MCLYSQVAGVVLALMVTSYEEGVVEMEVEPMEFLMAPKV